MITSRSRSLSRNRSQSDSRVTSNLIIFYQNTKTPQESTPPEKPYHLPYQSFRHCAVLASKRRRPHKHASTLTRYPLGSPAPLRSSAAQAGHTKADRTELSRRQISVRALSGMIAPTLCRLMRQPRQLAALGCTSGVLDAVSCSFGVCLEWRDTDQISACI